MRIGLASIYAFRPHVEHLWYLARLLEAAGQQTFFLTCNGALEQCYPRALRGRPRLIECPTCILGGIRSYAARGVTAITSGPIARPTEELEGVVESSICTILRTETDLDLEGAAAAGLRASLTRAAERTFHAGVEWIRQNQLDGVVCFNGRMDVLRALTLACRNEGIPFVTLERSLFGDGLHLVPNGDCLSLEALRRLNGIYRSKPLTFAQAGHAGRLLASRFLRRNQNEWRAYNLNASRADWPLPSRRRRVLVLPSSWNEYQGHPDWETGWKDATAAFDWLFAQLGIEAEDVVVRCHPNWSERIGRSYGTSSEQHYTRWAQARGLRCIASNQTHSTSDLIQASDLVILNGSTAAFEAGALGKPMVCVGSGYYVGAGLVIHVTSSSDAHLLDALRSHDAVAAIRSTLRFGYTMSCRFPQYVDFVRSITPTRYQYYAGADAGRVVQMLKTGVVEPDDSTTAPNTDEEDAIVGLVREGGWQELFSFTPLGPDRPRVEVTRRPGLAWLDRARDLIPRGDRL